MENEIKSCNIQQLGGRNEFRYKYNSQKRSRNI